jgi:hypothetical protein
MSTCNNVLQNIKDQGLKILKFLDIRERSVGTDVILLSQWCHVCMSKTVQQQQQQQQQQQGVTGTTQAPPP